MEQQRKELIKNSLSILKAHQHESGAFLASPTFSQYGYSWLRDNTYNAYALLLYGYEDEVRSYIQWVNNTLILHRNIIESLPEKLQNGKELTNADFLGARYGVNGEIDTTDWPNFQIDGYGSWLWLVIQYLQRNGAQSLPESWKEGISLAIDYLSLVWQLPNSDCWEEHPQHIHPSTLACVGGGLKAVSKTLGSLVNDNVWKMRNLPKSAETAEKVISYLMQHKHPSGRFPKYIGSESIDASLIWISVPYGIVKTDHPAMQITIQAIENLILEEGGVKRYPEDTYYGGGQWVILSAWLAWFYVEDGRTEKAEPLLEWIMQQQMDDGSLPEQVLDRTNDPSMIQPWVERWGEVAAPLLWSHAMYLILEHAMQQDDSLASSM